MSAVPSELVSPYGAALARDDLLVSTALTPRPSLAEPAAWRFGASSWAWLLAALAAAGLVFGSDLVFMAATWQAVPEFSHGFLIPLVCGFLLWQRAGALRPWPLPGSWAGLFWVGTALLLALVGQWSAVRVISQLGFVLLLCGLAWATIGWQGVRVMAVPLLLLFLMVPLPQFVLLDLSQQLQLLSSQLGVAIIRWFGISVFLEGNVIDLGSYKLQVADACSGLRYLFPLFVLGCLAANFFSAPMWQRLLLVASTIPLTILTNSLRIGLIGVTVEHWGPHMAEGLLHDFEGWFVFMICVALLVLEIQLLVRWFQPGRRRQVLRDAFFVQLPEALPPTQTQALRPWPKPLAAAAGVLMLAALAWQSLPERSSATPSRQSFDGFPNELPGGLSGRAERLDRDVQATLATDDHLLLNFSRPAQATQPAVNLFIAYYASQSGGQSTHSPRTCLPAGGWRVERLSQQQLPAAPGLAALPVNRVLIQKGEQRQLVYYWFQQRGRTLTGELAVKWYILQDGLTQSRSDGALVRVVTLLAPGEAEDQADRRLQALLAGVRPQLARFVPD